MSEAKHTKGPWMVDAVSTFGAYGVWTDYATHPGHDGAGYGSQICSMFTVSFQQTDQATRAERDANARLIAAAPDLLAACGVALLTRACDKATRDMLRAAIAKATGGSA